MAQVLSLDIAGRVVIRRKVLHGTRSAKGLENRSLLRRFFETARRQGQKPRGLFQVLLTQQTARAQTALYRRDLAGGPQPGHSAKRGKPLKTAVTTS